MKKALFIAMIAALTVVSGSCGKNETPAAVTTAAQPTKTYPELNFPDTDWADNRFIHRRDRGYKRTGRRANINYRRTAKLSIA